MPAETARREAGAALVEALDVLSAALPRAVEMARTEARVAERAAVVAYLRDCALVSAQLDAPLAATNFQSAASAIERGEHRREEETK